MIIHVRFGGCRKPNELLSQAISPVGGAGCASPEVSWHGLMKKQNKLVGAGCAYSEVSWHGFMMSSWPLGPVHL